MRDLIQPQQLYSCAQRAQEWQRGCLHILGFGFDGTACFRKGARFGPDAIRKVSADIENYSPYLDRDLEEIPAFYDLGNLTSADDGQEEKVWRQGTDLFFALTKAAPLRRAGARLLLLGGEHSVSYGPIARYLEDYPDLAIVHLDAHADLRDGYQGYHYSHASILRRVADHLGPGHRLLQFGIRSGTRAEFAWMREHGTLQPTLAALLGELERLERGRPVYLTCDLDFFDPCFLPGTGTPEPGGQDFLCFIELIKVLARMNFVGADVVELAPPLDASGVSDVFATKVVREVILALSEGVSRG